jgi:DNA primase
MNVEQANAIDLSAILKSIGVMPHKQQGMKLWYASPFRNEKTPSLHVNASKNVWYDFGQAKGGNAVDFVCEYLASNNEDHTVQDALRWLKNMQTSAPLEIFSKEETPNYGATLELRKGLSYIVSVLHGQNYSIRGLDRSI